MFWVGSGRITHITTHTAVPLECPGLMFRKSGKDSLLNRSVKCYTYVYCVADESLRCSRKESQKGRQTVVCFYEGNYETVQLSCHSNALV
jgi:hypothetical protein